MAEKKRALGKGLSALLKNPDTDIIALEIPDPDTENKSLSCKLIRTQMKR